MTKVKTPLVLWAQHSSATNKEKNCIYLTIKLQGIIHSTLTLTVTETAIFMNVKAEEGNTICEYGFEFEFYAEVVPDAKVSKEHTTPHSVTIVIFKNDTTTRDWPQLSRNVLDYIKPDSRRWTPEGHGPGATTYKIGSTYMFLSGYSEAESEGFLESLNEGTSSFGVKIPTPERLTSAPHRPNIENLENIFSPPVNDANMSELKDQLSNIQLKISRDVEQLLDMGDVTKSKSGPDLDQDKLNPSKLDNTLNAIVAVGSSYIHRFNRTEDLEDINCAISLHHMAVKLTPPRHSDLPRYLKILGHSCFLRFRLTGDQVAIKAVISCLQKAIEIAPPGYPEHTDFFRNLAVAFGVRFQHTGNLEDLDCAILHYQKEVDSTPSGEASFPTALRLLGMSHFNRFELTAKIHDLDCAIDSQQRAIKLTANDDTDVLDILDGLGRAYLSRFETNRNLDDISLALFHYQKAVDLSPSGDENLLMRLNNLGMSYVACFEHTADPEDINHSISYLLKAVELITPEHASFPVVSQNVGKSYLHRFHRSGDIGDLDWALIHYQKAVASTSPAHDRHLVALENLGNACIAHFERTGDTKSIDLAVSHHHKVVDLTPSGHALLSSRYTHLGNAYMRRFQCTSNIEDINLSISYHEKAVQLVPSGHASLPTLLGNLGCSYASRSDRTGSLEDIDCAISHHQKGVHLAESGHAELSTGLSNLGLAYLRRFDLHKNLHDINCAISHQQRAIDIAPTGDADLPRLYQCIGNSLLRRFEYTGDINSIGSAISYYEKGIELTPSDHASLPSWFNNLGISYKHRFEQTGNLEDIHSSINSHKKSVDLTPSGLAVVPTRFSNLGNAYRSLFKHTGDLKDIDSAIIYHKKALEVIPSGHSDLSSMFNCLGNSYWSRFRQSDNDVDIQQSISLYRRGAEANGSPSERLTCARQAATHSLECNQPHCLHDFSLCINLLSEVAGLEQTVHRRHDSLLGYSSLMTFAVTAALQFGRHELAVEWLEQGRCLVWNQINQLRTPIDQLSLKNPTLANRFITVASALEFHGTRSTPSRQDANGTLVDAVHLQDQTLDHTRLAGEYRELLKEIRSLPDFDNFLRPPQATNLLSCLPPDGQVVIFNIHANRGEALALTSRNQTPLHIPLENFSFEQAEKLVKVLHVGALKHRGCEDYNEERASRLTLSTPKPMSFVLEELWSRVVWPVLRALGYMVPPAPANRPRIWWCPTGPLAFLPIHAAGIYGQLSPPGSCVSEFVISSYTPTVHSIKDKFSMRSTQCTKLLLVSQPNTPGLSQIPSTREETDRIKNLIKGTAVDVLSLGDSQATIEEVKKAINACNWVHFACHGVQDSNQALQSGLCLHDGRLDLLEIIKHKIPNPELAFLSACQTSKGDIKLSEEVVHLAAGMLAAGYRGVVGTMWNISDRHGPDFATEFYQYLLNGNESEGLESTKAAYALDHATNKVRESLGNDEKALLTWVPYIHFGY